MNYNFSYKPSDYFSDDHGSPLNTVDEPELLPDEVTIASFGLWNSYTYAIVCIRAKPAGDKINYRLVASDTLNQCRFDYPSRESKEPLSFQGLVEFIAKVRIIPTPNQPRQRRSLVHFFWNPIPRDDENLPTYLDSAKAISKFYPEFGEYYRQEALKYYKEVWEEGIDTDDEEYEEKDWPEIYQKLTGQELLNKFDEWYNKGARFPYSDADDYLYPNDFLTNVLKNRGKEVLGFLNNSNLKNKSKILNSILEISCQPYKRGGSQVNIGPAVFNCALRILKKEVLNEEN